MIIFILLFLTLVPEVLLQDQPGPVGTPQLGDLMVGRAAGLSASSTCGLRGPEDYCIIGYLQEQQKCFTCDSRLPYSEQDNQDSHRIENIITSLDPDPKRKWWQSENGVHQVSIQLDLRSMFQLSHLIITFKSFRPAAMLVESSKDSGRTWNVLRYFAEDCLLHFPSVSDRPAERVNDVVCDSRYSGSEPSSGGQVVLKILDPVFGVEDPYASHIQDWTTMTNIRVNLTHLYTLGDTLLGRKRRNPWGQNKYFYAIYNMAVHGRCFCNGHADNCVAQEEQPEDGSPPNMVHGRCVCLHNTAGDHCERCAALHNDAPWRPGVDSCRSCDCNGNSDSCHFDAELFETTGRGGVCDNCRNGRAGSRCELCAPRTYQDPQKPPEDPTACIPCDCSSEGAVGYGQCDPRTGSCTCKENVDGYRCERCKYGFFGLHPDDEAGCRRCECHVMGSYGTCDQLTGSCECHASASGPLCDRCKEGFWGLGNSEVRCSPCDCDVGGAYSNICSPDDGQCQCLPNMGGRRCDEPAPGHFLPSLDYFLYEAELASPLDVGAPPSSPLTTTGLLPQCENFLRQQGYDFEFSNGRIVVVRGGRRRRKRQWIRIPQDSGSALQIIPRQRTGDGPETWTGVGVVRVLDGSGLRITVDNLPRSMDYQLVIRYETEDPSDWLASVDFTTRSTGSRECGIEASGGQRLLLSGRSRLAILEPPMCLNRGAAYFLDLVFTKDPRSQHTSSSHVLVDSVGLVPRVQGHHDVCSSENRPSGVRCIGLFVEQQFCEGLALSVSARIHQGALPCRCFVIGSVSTSCNKVGGACECKPHVIGNCCDKCSPLTFDLGLDGCKPCECDPRGALSDTCDQTTGRCECRPEVTGRQCERCQSGAWGFPGCRPCDCNGLSEFCEGGECMYCRENAAGPRCERCQEDFYGDPAAGHPCQPCACPDVPGSGRHFAQSCQFDPQSLSATCLCQPGHTGPRCDRCLHGFYADLSLPGNSCKRCSCNDNIDVEDSDACDVVTGECLRCLHGTTGPQCQECKPGYYGDADIQDCRECGCDRRGTQVTQCPVGSPCSCDGETGQCVCRTGVAGVHCDRCEDGFWNLDGGCQACSCHPANAFSDICDKVSGQCLCRPSFSGRDCDECEDNHFGDPDLQCVSCDCDLEGTLRPSCDPESGDCMCRPGVAGMFCDQCAPGHTSFPACEPCHRCSDLWAESVKDVQTAAKTMVTLIPRDHDRFKPGDPLHTIANMTSILEGLTNLKTRSPGRLKELEELTRKLRRMKEKVDPGLILIDTSKILNSDIDSIRLDFHQIWKNLKSDVEEGDDDTEPDDPQEFWEQIKNHHEASASDEKRIQKTKKVLEDAKNLRMKANEMLKTYSSSNPLLQMNKKVEDLSVSHLESQICGQGLKNCSSCGDQVCSGIVPNIHYISKKVKEAEDVLFVLPSTISISMEKVRDVKRKTQETQDQTKMFQKRISEHKNQEDLDKNVTRALIQRIKDYLTDNSLPPEDIEKMSQAVLNIKLPGSSDQIQRMIQDIRNLLKEISKSQENVQKLGDIKATVRQLVEDAARVQDAVGNLPDPEEIRRDLYAAEAAQDKANDGLEASSRDTDAIKDAIAEINEKLVFVNMKMKDDRTVYLQDTINQLKKKAQDTEQKIRDAVDTAESASDTAQEAKTDLAEVERKFADLDQMDKDQQTEADQKLKDMLKETTMLKETLENKQRLIDDLDQRMNNLIRARDEKLAELKTFIQTLEDLRKEIDRRVQDYSTCT